MESRDDKYRSLEDLVNEERRQGGSSTHQGEHKRFEKDGGYKKRHNDHSHGGSNGNGKRIFISKQLIAF